MKNEYKITKELMMSWAKEYHLHGSSNIIGFVLWCFLGVLALFMVFLLLTVGGDWTYWYFASLFLFVSVYKLFFARFVVWSKRYKMYSKTYGVTEWMRTTEFSDDEIIVSDCSSMIKLRYDNIQKIKEKGNVVMIFMNDNMAIRLYKDAFVEGSWEECKAMIDAKLK